MVLTSAMSLREALKRGWPREEDIRGDRVFRDDRLICKVTNLLRDRRYCLIEGAEKRGKTTLARLVGYAMQEEQWNVRVIEISETKTTDELEYLLRMIPEWDRTSYLVIVEDCHLAPDFAPNTSERVMELAMTCAKAHFLFTSRLHVAGHQSIPEQIAYVEVNDIFANTSIREDDLTLRLETNKRVIERVVTQYIKSHHLGSAITPDGQDYNFLVRNTGGNLRLLTFWLEAWEAECTLKRLKDVSRKMVLEKFANDRLKSLGRRELELLKELSAIGQFELPVYSKGLCLPSEHKNILPIVDELEGKGLVFGKRDPVLLLDTESRLTLECLEDDWRGYSQTVVTAYLQSGEAKNYAQLLHCLGRTDSRWLLERIIKDAAVFTILMARIIKDADLGVLRVVLDAGHEVDKIRIVTLMKQIDDSIILEKMRHSTPIEIMLFLEVVQRIESERAEFLRGKLVLPDNADMWIRSGPNPFYRFLAIGLSYSGKYREWAKQIYENVAKLDLTPIVNASSDGPNKTTRDWGILVHYGPQLSSEATRVICEQIAKNLAIANVHASLKGLTQLLRNMESVARGASAVLLRRLFETDPLGLTERCEIHELADFLWRACIIDSDATRDWVEHIGEKKWAQAINRGESLEAFHLLLDIYQANNGVGLKTKELVGSAIIERLYSQKETEPDAVALVGLLMFLGLRVDKVFRLPQIKAILDSQPQEMRIARALFSLFCIEKLEPRLEYEFVDEILKRADLSSHFTLLLSEFSPMLTTANIEEILTSYRIRDRSGSPGPERLLMLIIGALGDRLYSLDKPICSAEVEKTICRPHEWTSVKGFRTRSNAKRWLYWAVDQNMFLAYPVSDKKGLHWELYPNFDNPVVSSTLMKARSVLIALKDAQGDSQYATPSMWDEILKQRFDEDVSFPISRLGHLKCQLLAVGTVEAQFLSIPAERSFIRCNVNQANRLTQFLLSREPEEMARIVSPERLADLPRPVSSERLADLLREIPPVRDGIIEVKAVARRRGIRSKIAVSACREGVDAVSTCIGAKNQNLEPIIRELCGEAIDIVQWDPDPAVFIANALTPARPTKVEVDEPKRKAVVVISDRQIPLAIGKGAQNVQLASTITGFRIVFRDALGREYSKKSKG
jgi:transcription antitermination factor NusA-like protein